MSRRKKNDPSEMVVSNIQEEQPASKKIKLEKDIEDEEKDSWVGSDCETESYESESPEGLSSNISRIVHRVDPDPECDEDSVLLSWYDSDLNLVIDEKTFSAAAPLHWRGFCFLQAGVRTTHGFHTGQLCFEVKITGLCHLKYLEGHLNTHLIRVGWSPLHSSLALGSDFKSFGYDSNGRASTKGEIKDYGITLTVGDVVGAYLDFNATPAVLTFSVNGKDQGVAYEMEHSETNNVPMFPHILTKNMAFECNFHGVKPWFPPKTGFTFVGDTPLKQRVPGPRAPKNKADCEVIMLIGLPKSGKSTWAQTMSANHPGKYYIISVENLVDKMELSSRKRKAIFLRKACVLGKLLQISTTRCRNYILDQVNATRSGQEWKMRLYKQFQRRAVVFVIPDAELQKRMEKEHRDDRVAVNLMKAKLSLPEPTYLVNRIDYAELPQFEAEKLVKQYRHDAWLEGPLNKNFTKRTFSYNRKGRRKSFLHKSIIFRRKRYMGGRSPSSWENNQMHQSRPVTPLSEELAFRDMECYSPRNVDNWPTSSRPRSDSVSPPRNIGNEINFSPDLQAGRDFHGEQLSNVAGFICADSRSPNDKKFGGWMPGSIKRKRSFSPPRDAEDYFIGPRNLNNPDFLQHQEGDFQDWAAPLQKGRVEDHMEARNRPSSLSPHREFLAHQGPGGDDRYAPSRSYSFKSNVDFPPHTYCDGSEVRMNRGFPAGKEMDDLSAHRRKICRDGFPQIEERSPGEFSPGGNQVRSGFSCEKVRGGATFSNREGRSLPSFQSHGCLSLCDGIDNIMSSKRSELEGSDGPIGAKEQEMVAIGDSFHDPRPYNLPRHESRDALDSMATSKSRGGLSRPSASWEERQSCGWLPSEVGLYAGNRLMKNENAQRNSEFSNFVPIERESCHSRRDGSSNQSAGSNWHSHPCNEFSSNSQHHSLPPGIRDKSHYVRDMNIGLPPSGLPREISPVSQGGAWGRIDHIPASEGFGEHFECDRGRSLHHGTRSPAQAMIMPPIQNSRKSPSHSPQRYSYGSWPENLRSPMELLEPFQKESTEHIPRSRVQGVRGSLGRDRRGSPGHNSGTSSSRGLRESPSRGPRGSHSACLRESASRDHIRSSHHGLRGSTSHSSKGSVCHLLKHSPVDRSRLPSAEGPRDTPPKRETHVCGSKRSGRATRWSSPIRESVGISGERRESPFNEVSNWDRKGSLEREHKGPPIQCKRGPLNRDSRRSPNWNSREPSNVEPMQSSREYDGQDSQGSPLPDSRTSLVQRHSLCEERAQIRNRSPYNESNGSHRTPKDFWVMERDSMGNWPRHTENEAGRSAEGMCLCGKQKGLHPNLDSSHSAQWGQDMPKPFSSRGRFHQREGRTDNAGNWLLMNKRHGNDVQQRFIEDNLKERFSMENKPFDGRRSQCLRGRLGPKVSDEAPMVPIDMRSGMDAREAFGNLQPLHDIHRNRQSPHFSDTNKSRWERVPGGQPSNPDHEELAPYEQPFDQALWDSNDSPSTLKLHDRESPRNFDMELTENRAVDYIRPVDNENRGNIWARVGGYVDDDRELRKGPFNSHKEAVSFKDGSTLPRDQALSRRLSREREEKIPSRIGRRSPGRKSSPGKSHFESKRFTSSSKDRGPVRGRWKSPPRRRNTQW